MRAQAWYETQHPGLGKDFRSEVVRVLSRLEETPLIYPCIYKDFRRAVLRRYPYLVWYQVAGNVVRIFAVTAGRQDPMTIHDRLQ